MMTGIQKYPLAKASITHLNHRINITLYSI